MISEEAARWLLTLDDPSPAEKRDFVTWVRQSPEHLREFLAIAAASERLASFDWESLEEPEGLSHNFPGKVIQFPRELSASGKADPRTVAAKTDVPGTRRWWKAVAAGMGALLIAGGVWLQQTRSTVYETSVGEQRTVQLDDGSIMSLNTQSSAVFNTTREGRHVLLRGEATFTVAPDASKPFSVTAGSVVAVAIGTQFNVREYPSGATVSVLEGSVGVTAAAADARSSATPAPLAESAVDHSVVLTAGKEAHLDRLGAVRSVEIADPDSVLSWQQRRMVFRGNTLEDMVAEFNRWNRRKIRLEGRLNPEKRYDGVFSAADPESFLDFLALDERISVERSTDVVVLRPRTNPI